MTPQEQQLLDGLIERVRGTQLPAKDNEADRRIQETLGRDPNALYILCQSVLVQTYALEQAQKQLALLQAQAGQHGTEVPAPKEPSFLEKIFGRNDPEPEPAPVQQGQGGYGQPVYGGQPQYGQPGYARPGYGQPAYPQGGQPGYGQPQAYYPPQQGYPPQGGGFGSGFGGGGGFLQGALQTAAGVAMGELAFQSIEGLFRGFGHAAGYGSDRAMGFGDVGGGDSHDYGDGGGFFSREQAANGVNDRLSSDIEDRRGESHGFLGGQEGAAGQDGFVGDHDDSATDNGYDMDNSVAEDEGSDFSEDGGSDDGGSYGDDN